MTTPLQQKSSIQEIRERFDADVERFSVLETGQTATIDAPLAMELITRAALASTPHATTLLDIGCGAGNNTLKLLSLKPGLDCHLLDLSAPMIERARQRVAQAGAGRVAVWEGDFRTVGLPEASFDIVLAAAVLHHLRDEADWEAAFAKVFRLLRPGGSFWITDLVSHEDPAVQELMWKRYGEYLESLGGPAYRDKVFAYIDREDSPRPVGFQMDLLRRVGFARVDLLHKNSCFAALGAVKSPC